MSITSQLTSDSCVTDASQKHCPRCVRAVLAKHSKSSFSLIDCVSVGVYRMQRNFEPMRKQVEVWQHSELADVTVKVIIYEAFVEDMLLKRVSRPTPVDGSHRNRTT